MNKINLAIVGATGLVGRTFIKVLQEYKFNKHIKKIYLFASKKSVGKTIRVFNKKIQIEELTENNITNKKIDYAFFAVGEKISHEYAQVFTKQNCVVIDNSSAFRMDKNVPLVVPEVNFDCIKDFSSKIIANPNCSTIQCMLPLKVLNKNYGIKKINFATYQAVSGSGNNGIESLKQHNKNKFYPYIINKNCLPHIGSFLPSGYTTEEMKMINETKKILKLSKNVQISSTCVRVPIQNCHSVEIDVELKQNFDVEMVRTQLSSFENIIVLDDVFNLIYPLASIAKNSDKVFVGRIRKDLFNPKILHMFCVADNLRKGASSNGVQILQKLLEN